MRYVRPLVSILILICLKTVAPAQGPPKLELVVQTGHTDKTTSAALSGDGKYLVTGGDDDIAILWDVASGKKLQTFQGHMRPVKCVAVSRDGKQVVTGSSDGKAIVWNSASGKRTHTFQAHDPDPNKRKMLRVGPPLVRSVALSDDGKRAVSAAHDGTIVWETASGKVLNRFEGYLCVDLSGDGKQVLTGTAKTATLWDVASGKKLQVYQGNAGLIRRATLSQDGKLVVTASDDGMVTVWAAAGGGQLHAYQAPVGKGFAGYGYYGLDVSRDGTQVLTISLEKGRMKSVLWDAVSGEQLQTFNEFCLALSGDGKYVVTVFDDKTPILWDASGKKLHTLQSHTAIIKSLLSGDGNHVITRTKSGGLGQQSIATQWDSTGGKKLPEFSVDRAKNVRQSPSPIALSHDGKLVLIGLATTVILSEAASGKQLQTFVTKRISSGSLSRDGKHVLIGSSDGTATLWEAAGGKQLQTFQGHTGTVHSVAFSSDGKHVVTGDVNGAILWQAADGKKLQTFQGPTEIVTNVALAGDGKYVLTGSPNGTAIVWEASSGKQLHTFQGPFEGHTEGRVKSVALSGKGKFAVIGFNDLTAILWDADSGKNLQTFHGHSEVVGDVAISANGKQVWTSSLDGTTRLWDPTTGKERCRLYTLNALNPKAPFQAALYAGKDWLVVTPDGFWEGSEGVERHIAYRETGTLKLVDDDITRKRFHRPGLLAQAWKDEK